MAKPLYTDNEVFLREFQLIQAASQAQSHITVTACTFARALASV